jgi:hypothetical protein
MDMGEIGVALDMVLSVEPIVSLDLACSTSMCNRLSVAKGSSNVMLGHVPGLMFVCFVGRMA